MLTGVALKVVSTLVFAFMMTIMKAHTDYPLGELVLFRSAPALLVLFVWLILRGEFPGALRTQWLSGHLVRSVAGACSMFLMFATYTFLPLADSTAVLYTGPMMIVVLSGIFLGERVSALRIGVVVMGFAGVLIMLAEHLGVGHAAAPRGALGVACGLGGAFCVAIAMIQTRRLAKSEHTGAIVFYFQATSSLIAIAFMAAGWLWPASAPLAGYMQAQAWVWPTPQAFVLMFIAGLCGGLGQILMTSAYRYADASIIAVFEYASMIWVVSLGIIFLGEYPSAYVLAGASVVSAAGVLLVMGERRRVVN